VNGGEVAPPSRITFYYIFVCENTINVCMHIKDYYLFIVKSNNSQHSTRVVCAIADYNCTRTIHIQIK